MRKLILFFIGCSLTVFVSAQLMSNRQMVLSQMLLRFEDPWPLGEGHLVLATPGSMEQEKAYIEPNGTFSPAFRSFGVGFWLSDKYNRTTAFDNQMPLHYVEQSFEAGKQAAIKTVTPDYSLIHKFNSAYDCSIEVDNKKNNGKILSMVIRAVGPAGAPIRKIFYDGKNIILNDEWYVSIHPKPTMVYMGDETNDGWTKSENETHLFESNTGWAFVRAVLYDNKHTVRMYKLTKSSTFPLLYKSLQSDLKIDLPDPRFAASINAQVQHLMMGIVRDELRPGEPNNYPLPWLRDGAYALVALARAGQIDLAKTLALYFARNDFFGGFGPEADAPGIAIWGIMMVANEINDTAFNKEIWPHIKRKSELIEKMIHTKDTIRMPITHPILKQYKEKKDLDLVCYPAKDGLIMGRMDWHNPILFINSVSYSGLKYASQLAEQLDHSDLSIRWKNESMQIQKSWIAAFDKEWNNDRTFICSFWPDWIAAPIKENYIEKASSYRAGIYDEYGDFKQTPLWTYFNVSEAHQWLYLQKTDYCWNTVEWFWNNQAATGLYTWWEGNGEENTSGRWENVCGWVKPNHVTPHYWTASEMLNLQLDMLAFIDHSGAEPVLIIGEGVKKEWLSKPMKIEGIRLEGRIINWNWDGKKLLIQMTGSKMKVQAGSSFPVKTKCSITYL